MPLNPAKVALAVQSGLSTVCATCTRYWEGRDRGLPGDACTARKPCVSPLDGGDYPEYLGPLQEFTVWCFICGDNAACAVQRRGSTRLFGVCAGHRNLLPKMAPTLNHTDSSLVVLTGGQQKTLATLLPYKKPTLWERIAETEKEFEKIDRERGLIPEEP